MSGAADVAPAAPPAVAGLPRVLQAPVEASLAGRVRRGVAWTAGSRAVVQVLQVGATAVLARLLTPADYGLGALVAVVTGLAAILVDLGVPAAVVQRRDLDERYLATAFWMNALLGLVLAGGVCAAAVPVARFFDEPELVGLVLLSSLTFVLSLNAVHVAVLQRALQFGALGRISLVTTSVGLVVSIAAAAAGMGATSLVLGPVAERLASVVQVWVAVRWLPRVGPSREAARDIWAFGRGITGSNLIGYAVTSADRILIGRVVTVVALGYYNRAANLMQLPIQQTTRTLTGVFFPALAAMAGDVPRMRSAWLRLLRASWIVGVPVGVGLALTAPVLVRTLYGDGWDPVAPLLVVLSVGIPFLLVSATTAPVYQALGRTGLQFRLGLVNAAVALAVLAVGVRWGVTGVAIAWVVRTFVGLVISLVPMLRLLGAGIGSVAGALWRTGLAGTATGLAVWAAARGTEHLAAPLALGVQVATGVLVYGAMAWALEREALGEFIGRGLSRRRRPTVPRPTVPRTTEGES